MRALVVALGLALGGCALTTVQRVQEAAAVHDAVCEEALPRAADLPAEERQAIEAACAVRCR